MENRKGFGEKLKFWRGIEILGKNQHFWAKSNYLRKNQKKTKLHRPDPRLNSIQRKFLECPVPELALIDTPDVSSVVSVPLSSSLSSDSFDFVSRCKSRINDGQTQIT